MGIFFVFKKPSAPSYTAKSVILDIADNYGGEGIGLRSIDFYLNDVLIDVVQGDINAYSPDDEGQNGMQSFITAHSKTGGAIGYYINGSTDQRIICEFSNEITFDKILVNNYHNYGENTDNGAKTVVMYISSAGIDGHISSDYDGNIDNSTQIFSGDFDRHVDEDVVDNQILTLVGIEPVAPEEINTFTGVKSLIIDIVDNWGSESNLGFRSIEITDINGDDVEDADKDAAIATTNSEYYLPQDVLDHSKIGMAEGRSWRATSYHWQRFIIVFRSMSEDTVDFENIIFNNYHDSGDDTDIGMKNIMIMTSPSVISDTGMGNIILDSTLIFDGQIPQHVFNSEESGDVEDPYDVPISIPEDGGEGEGGEEM